MNHDVNPQLIVLVGAPASGKSTYIKNAGLNDYVIISTDAIIEEAADREGKTYSEIFQDTIKVATTLANIKFDNAIADKKNIVFDQTNMSAKKRKGILSRIPKFYTCKVVVFNIPLEVVERRAAERCAQTGKCIPAHVIADMYKRFEMPTLQEGFDDIEIVTLDKQNVD